MHIHLGVAHLVGVFLGVLLLGTLWRILAFKLAAANSQMAEDIGKAMAFMY